MTCDAVTAAAFPGVDAEAPSRGRVDIAGVQLDNYTMDEALAWIEAMIARRTPPTYAVTPNVDHIVKVRYDETFGRAYAEAPLVLADGMPIMWAARLLKTPLKEKVSGSDLFPRFCEVAARKGYKLFFLGGRPGAIEEAERRLRVRYQGLKVVGMYCPPMGFEKDPVENRKTINLVRESGADLLFVGLGTPKQENWIYRHHRDVGVPVSIGIGASFDFMAGQQKRAPVLMQKMGLEWFWRLVLEPKRMYRRYLIEDPEFLALVWRQHRANQRARRARAAERLAE